MIENIIITGAKINYYFICHRKLWFFAKNISMEHTSELVEIGKIIHESTYQRKKKEVHLEGIKIDIIEANKGVIHEIKKSRSFEESHKWQLKYYLYYLKQLGVIIEGIIDYPKIRRREIVTLIEEDENKIQQILSNIQALSLFPTPPPVINKPYCKKCSYYEFCYC